MNVAFSFFFFFPKVRTCHEQCSFFIKLAWFNVNAGSPAAICKCMRINGANGILRAVLFTAVLHLMLWKRWLRSSLNVIDAQQVNMLDIACAKILPDFSPFSFLSFSSISSLFNRETCKNSRFLDGSYCS